MTEKKTELLVVDDDQRHRNFLIELFEGHGYSVRAASDGAEALDSLEASRPDAVLLDMVMPRATVDGFAFISRLRLAKPEVRAVPLVLVSGLGESLSDAIDPKDAETLNIKAVLHKPVDIAESLRVVRAATEQRAG